LKSIIDSLDFDFRKPRVLDELRLEILAWKAQCVLDYNTMTLNTLADALKYKGDKRVLRRIAKELDFLSRQINQAERQLRTNKALPKRLNCPSCQ